MNYLNIAYEDTAFSAFGPKRQVIMLCIGDKGNQKRFYKEMLATADQQYECHLRTLGDP